MKFILSVLLLLSILAVSAVVANEGDMKSWEKPCVVDWSGTTLTLGGIKPKQLQHLFIWSMDDASLVWFVRSNKRQDYTKESSTNSVRLRYGVPLNEWEQLYPKSGKPRDVREHEVICVSLSWAFPYMFGMRGDVAYFYYHKKKNTFESLTPSLGKVAGKDVTDFLNQQARVISLLEAGRLPPNYPERNGDVLQ